MTTIHRSPETRELVDWPKEWDVIQLLAESRSKRTQDWRLKDGRILETYELSSGNVDANIISEINPSLTIRY
jgi:hypothetical protein